MFAATEDSFSTGCSCLSGKLEKLIVILVVLDCGRFLGKKILYFEFGSLYQLWLGSENVGLSGRHEKTKALTSFSQQFFCLSLSSCRSTFQSCRFQPIKSCVVACPFSIYCGSLACFFVESFGGSVASTFYLFHPFFTQSRTFARCFIRQSHCVDAT